MIQPLQGEPKYDTRVLKRGTGCWKQKKISLKKSSTYLNKIIELLKKIWEINGRSSVYQKFHLTMVPHMEGPSGYGFSWSDLSDSLDLFTLLAYQVNQIYKISEMTFQIAVNKTRYFTQYSQNLV